MLFALWRAPNVPHRDWSMPVDSKIVSTSSASKLLIDPSLRRLVACPELVRWTSRQAWLARRPPCGNRRERKELRNFRRGNVHVGKPTKNRIGCVHAIAGQRQVGANVARRSRQQKGRADVGKNPIPTSGIATAERSVTMRCEACAETPTPPPITTPSITAITGFGYRAIRTFRWYSVDQNCSGRGLFDFRRIVQRANIAARAQAALARSVDENGADIGIGCPGAQIFRHGDGHVERQRIERFRPVQCDPPQRPLGANDDIALVKDHCAYRPTRLLATMRRMISLVPSRIWCTRKSRTIFSMPNSER